MFKLSAVLLSLAFSQATFAMECAISFSPAKVFNRCPTPRTRGGEVSFELVTIKNSRFGVINAPQTFQYLYTMTCKDACGTTSSLIADVYWDCVAPQVIAGISIEQSIDDKIDYRSCSKENGLAPIDYFHDFLEQKFGRNGKPKEMPPPNPGISYWPVEK